LASKTITQSQDILAGGRYLSGDEAIRVFAAGHGLEGPYLLTVRWPGGDESSLEVQPNHRVEVVQPAGGGAPARPSEPSTMGGSTEPPLFADATATLGFRHVAAPFDESALQPLLPRRLSTLGPPLAWWDANDDGWEDLVVGGGKLGGLMIYTNQAGKSFVLAGVAPVFPGDPTALLAWATGQGQQRLLVAMSNYELPRGEPSEIQAFDSAALSAPRRWSAGLAATGPLAVADVDGDGDLDLFVGGRSMPGRYPEPAPSMIWTNEGDRLKPSDTWSDALRTLGLVTGAVFADFDADGAADLAVSTEWGTLRVFRNHQQALEEVTAPWGFSDTPGLWQCLAVGDFDEDGRLDLAAGNWGLNSAYALTGPGPQRLYYGDWDQDGRVEVIEAWRQVDRWMPLLDRRRLAAGLPEVQHRFPTHAAYAAASLEDILSAKTATTRWVEATSFESVILLNRGNRWERRPLPQAAQLSPSMGIAVGDLDGDGHEDLLLAQNFFGGAADWTREDAGQGLWLRGDGKGGFIPADSRVSGVRIDGEQRAVVLADLNHDGRTDLAMSQHDGPTRLFLNQGARPGLRVTVRGPTANPAAIGTQLRLVYDRERLGPARAVLAGSGPKGCATLVLGMDGLATGLQVRWPDGKLEILPLSPGTAEITIAWK
ncbi:MAG: VCBS repeat-containing protein, partial [Verrucomicrobiales bacterium]|nr:VCBS repeat-containing protein [Verrucomicrobiales bacterium]